MDHRLQAGIYFESGTKPPPAYRLLLVNAAAGATRSALKDALAEITASLDELRVGQPPELLGQPEKHLEATRELFARLDVLIGYGRRFFDQDLHEPALTQAPRPDFLAYVARKGNPFPALPWLDETTSNRGEADIALQFTGDSQAAVNCAAVEVWKLIVDRGLPVEPVDSFDGFGRIDGRGWLEFHDGVSNMDSKVRLEALEASADPEWMCGGTYMAYLRIIINLAMWRQLGRTRQELLVGRDKLTGAALSGVTVDPQGHPCPVARPFPGSDASAEERAEWRDPPETTHPLLEASHVHRANQSRASPGAPGSLRMFRQGYEFLEGIGPDGPDLGLNFVSFQCDLRNLQHVLHLPGWLGDVNFGGSASSDSQPPRFLALDAAGLYAVPPREEPFPGIALLA